MQQYFRLKEIRGIRLMHISWLRWVFLIIEVLMSRL